MRESALRYFIFFRGGGLYRCGGGFNIAEDDLEAEGGKAEMFQSGENLFAAEVAQIRVDGTAGGGMVTIKMDGHKNVLGVKIDPEVAGDVEMLQDLVLAASNDAAKKVDEESQKKMGGMLGGLGLPPGLF